MRESWDVLRLRLDVGEADAALGNGGDAERAPHVRKRGVTLAGGVILRTPPAPGVPLEALRACEREDGVVGIGIGSGRE